MIVLTTSSLGILREDACGGVTPRCNQTPWMNPGGGIALQSSAVRTAFLPQLMRKVDSVPVNGELAGSMVINKHNL